MQSLLDFLYEKSCDQWNGMTKEEEKLDEKIREYIGQELLDDYLKLQDSLLSNRVVGEKESYHRGFKDAVELLKNLNKL